MARGRMISKSLGSSKKFADLGTATAGLAEFAQLLFILLVVNADDFGRLDGDAFTAKFACFPTSPRPLEDFECALEHLVRAGLVARYLTEAHKHVVQIQQWERHQSGLNKRTRSRFPDAPPVRAGVESGDDPSVCGSPGTSGTFMPVQGNSWNLLDSAGVSASTEQKRTEHPERPSESRVTSAPEVASALDRFETFWKAYPRKMAKEKARSEFLRLQVSTEQLEQMLEAVQNQAASDQWRKEKGRFIPYPATWLNERRWEDESVQRSHDGSRMQSALYTCCKCNDMHLGSDTSACLAHLGPVYTCPGCGETHQGPDPTACTKTTNISGRGGTSCPPHSQRVEDSVWR